MDLEGFKKILKKYKKEDIVFSKGNYKDRILKYRNFDEEELKEELLTLDKIVHVEPQIRQFKGKKELRFGIYLVYSNSRGRFYSLKLNEKLKIVTVIPLGRKTLNKFRRRLKEGKR